MADATDDNTYEGMEMTEAMKAELAASKAEEEELMAEMRSRCKEAMDKRSSLASQEVDAMMNRHMGQMQDRYGAHVHEQVSVKQTDMLRTNKVFRDISPYLRDDWQTIFETLMVRVPQEETRAELEKLQKTSVMMRPYKALQVWKDYTAQEFSLMPLVETLRAHAHFELADSVLAIMQSEGASLMTINLPNRPTPRATAGDGEAGAAGDNRDTAGEERGGGAAAAQLKPAGDVQGPIGDRKLLQVAKEMGKDWIKVGQILGLSQEDLDEIRSNEGDGYTGGFKMLWLWKDGLEDHSKGLNKLVMALNKAGYTDFAFSLKKKD